MKILDVQLLITHPFACCALIADNEWPIHSQLFNFESVAAEPEASALLKISSRGQSIVFDSIVVSNLDIRLFHVLNQQKDEQYSFISPAAIKFSTTKVKNYENMKITLKKLI